MIYKIILPGIWNLLVIGISSNVLGMCHGMDYCSNQYKAISNQGEQLYIALFWSFFR